MSTTVRGLSPILDGYLDELDAATTHLPADEAFEIRDSIAAHIADATNGARHVDDDDARRIVRDLGPVSSIVSGEPASAAPLREAPAATSAASGAPGRAGYVSGACGALGFATFPLVPLSVALGLAAVVIGVAALRRHQQRGWALLGIVAGLGASIILPSAFLVIGSASGSGSGSSSNVTSYPAPPAYDTP